MNARVTTIKLLLALAILAIGCTREAAEPGNTVARPGEPQVTYVDDEDPKMVAAIQKARSTIDEFIQALANPGPSQSGFAIKLPVKDGEEVEHMWVSGVRYEGGRFIGTLDNEPVTVKTVKLGQEVEVARDELSDWMYLEGDKLVGGYTLHAMRDNMTPEERQDFDSSLPFKVE